MSGILSNNGTRTEKETYAGVPDAQTSIQSLQERLQAMKERNRAIIEWRILPVFKKAKVKQSPDINERVEASRLAPLPEQPEASQVENPLLERESCPTRQELQDAEAFLVGLKDEKLHGDLQFYFGRATAMEPLSKEEEIALGREIIKRRAALEKSVLQCDVDQLQDRFAQWQELRHQMVLANTRLVGSIAKRYRNCGLEFRDLISHGNIGLMVAVDKYDAEFNCTFATYAAWWVRQSIQRGIANQAKAVRVPENRIHTLVKIRTFARKHAEQHDGLQPSAEEIGEALGMSSQIIMRILGACSNAASLNNVAVAGDAPLENFLEDRKAPNPLVDACDGERRDTIIAALRSLSPRERKVVILLFGLGLKELPPAADEPGVRLVLDGEQYGVSLTFKEVAKILGITHTRVRQIEKIALDKLGEFSHPIRCKMALHK